MTHTLLHVNSLKIAEKIPGEGNPTDVRTVFVPQKIDIKARF